MAGHSKWKQIKRKKAVTDAKRGAVFTKVIREITVAAQARAAVIPTATPGCAPRSTRPRPRTCRSKTSSAPSRRAPGELEGVQYEEVVYEGYGPGRRRDPDRGDDRQPQPHRGRNPPCASRGTAATWAPPIRWPGCSSGRRQITVDAAKADEDTAMEAALDAGADDMVRDGDSF